MSNSLGMLQLKDCQHFAYTLLGWRWLKSWDALLHFIWKLGRIAVRLHQTNTSSRQMHKLGITYSQRASATVVLHSAHIWLDRLTISVLEPQRLGLIHEAWPSFATNLESCCWRYLKPRLYDLYVWCPIFVSQQLDWISMDFLLLKELSLSHPRPQESCQQAMYIRENIEGQHVRIVCWVSKKRKTKSKNLFHIFPHLIRSDKQVLRQRVHPQRSLDFLDLASSRRKCSESETTFWAFSGATLVPPCGVLDVRLWKDLVSYVPCDVSGLHVEL